MESEALYLLADEGKPYDIRHRAYRFSRNLVLLLKTIPRDPVFFSLYRQLLRSGTSIGANLVEGRAGSSRKDWKNYHAIALKSANETKYWICLIRDTLDQDRSRFNELLQEANELSKIIARMIIEKK